jgi:amidophosphoribosyltransferase
VILASLVQDLKGELPIFEELMAAVKSVFATVEGGYSVVGLIEGQGMFAFRDPKGIRPLVMGDVPGGQAFASETYALSFIGCENIIDVRPGELVWLDLKGALSRASLIQRAHAHCCFEYVYFTKGNAMIEGRDVYQARAALGRTLARQVRERGISVDVVTSVPSTSHPAALAMAWELQVRIEEGFIRRDNSGRTFILPTQSQRERAVSQKLAPVKSVFQGRDVLIVDDSIVRGTVSQRIIRMARQCGARKVYFASTFPPVAHPCYYGIDMHSQEELLAPGKSLEEIERILDADAVIYNSESDLKQAIGLNDLCIACCSGVYPTDLKGVQALKECRKRDQAESFLVVG